MKHFSEADLLETYYLAPGESLPVMMHLADCTDCAARYERLEKKMQSLRSCSHEHEPDSFWARQRGAILERVGVRRSSRVTRFAAAAAIAAAVTGAVAWNGAFQPSAPAATVVSAPEATAVDPIVPTPEESPWQSEELDEYASLVAWESWVEEGDPS